MVEGHMIYDLLILFGMGILAVVAFHRFNLPPVLGFLLTGVVCGPYGFKFVESVSQVHALAELGVVLLLFTIGIEFSFAKLKGMKKFLILGGGLQVLLTLAVTAALTMYFGLSLQLGVFFGMLVSLSSTVIVIRIFEHRGELDTAYAGSALTILIFQDLCIVPMVLAIPFIAGNGGDIKTAGLLIGKAVGLVIGVVFIARFLVPWFLNHVTNTRKREAFVLSVMLLCLGTGWAMSQVGLSMALGAFLAGLTISESKYSHQALSEIIPFREVFNFLVFVSIGMMFDVRTLIEHPMLIGMLLLALIVVKSMVASAVVFTLGHSLRMALLTGFALAQVSEFSFVLSKVGLEAGVVSAEMNQLFLAVAILSMLVTPAVYGAAPVATRLMELILPSSWISGRRDEPVADEAAKLKDHVIVIGLGVAGQTLIKVLTRAGIPYVAVDLDPAIVKSAREQKQSVFYGDGASPSVLEHARIHQARLVAIAAAEPNLAERATELARRLNPAVHIIVRSRRCEAKARLIELGAHEVVAEEFVGSLDMFSRVLQNLLVPSQVVERCMQDVRAEWDRDGNDVFQNAHPAEGLPTAPGGLLVSVRRIEPTDSIAGKTLEASGLLTTGTVFAIERPDGTMLRNPSGSEILLVGDSLVLCGKKEELLAAEQLLKV